MVKWTDRPAMTIAVDMGRKATKTNKQTHQASACPNPVKCVNCGLDHLSRSNVCEVWKKEKEIMKVKVTRNITYIEARKMVEQTPEVTFSKIVQSAVAKPELKTVSTQTSDEDKVIT